MSTKHRRPVLLTVDQLLWKLLQLEDTLCDPPHEHQELLEHLLRQYTDTLEKLRICSQRLEDDVPLDLIKFVDEGGNPDVFTRELFAGCVTANQEAKGKVLAFRELSRKLGHGLKEVYPLESKAFERMRSAGVSLVEQKGEIGKVQMSK